MNEAWAWKTAVTGGKGMARKAEKQPHDQRKADRVNQRNICLEGLLHEIMNFRARARSDSESLEQSSACLICTCARNGMDKRPIAPPVITSSLPPSPSCSLKFAVPWLPLASGLLFRCPPAGLQGPPPGPVTPSLVPSTARAWFPCSGAVTSPRR